MRRIVLPIALLCFAVPASAQLALPQRPLSGPGAILFGGGIGQVGGIGLPGVDDILGPLDRTVTATTATIAAHAQRLVRLRADRIEALVALHPDRIALDMGGQPARRGELLVLDAGPGMAAAEAAGFTRLADQPIEGLDMAVTRVAVPSAMTLAEAERALARLLPHATVSSDPLHFQSGGAEVVELAAAGATAARVSTPIGMIDGAAAADLGLTAQRGFADGAPVASNHGSAVASLLRGAGAATVRVADVYGTDPAGGNALAIARGLGWLTAQGSRVVTISLVGPKNPVLARAIASAQQRGVVVVAAVGNDGPASPPSYPASYPGVLAITGVDGRNRALIEAGRALHLDYAAPGADIFARDRSGQRRKVRGTSYATPLAAARVAAALAQGKGWRVRLDKEAEAIGPAKIFGQGVLCGKCARR